MKKKFLRKIGKIFIKIGKIKFILEIFLFFISFISHREHRENWKKEKQYEKEKKINEAEIEIINNTKAIKKPQMIVDNISSRLFNEAKRRKIKLDLKKEILSKEKEEKENYFSKSFVELKKDREIILNRSLINSNKTKYNFQVI